MNWKKQGSDEWLEMRRSHIMASDAPVIMEVSPFCTLKKLWERKLTGQEAYETKAMLLGKEMEPIARDLYCQKKNTMMDPDVVFHPHHTWMGASLDGISVCGSYAVEIKYCNPETNKIDHITAKNGRIPEKYYPQLQHQLAVLGIEEMDYCSFNGEDVIIVPVKRDEKYIEELIKREQEFYQCLKECREPVPYSFVEVDDTTWEQLTYDYGKVEEKKKRLKEELKNCEEQELAIKTAMIEYADGRNLKGSGWTFKRTEVKGRVEYKNIPELENVDLEQYRSEPTIRYTVKKV